MGKMIAGVPAWKYWANLRAKSKKPKSGSKIKRSRKPIIKITPEQKEQNALYKIARDEFFSKEENQVCCWPGCGKPATDLHHARGRGKFLLVKKWFRALCRKHHDMAGTPEAKEYGITVSRHAKNI